MIRELLRNVDANRDNIFTEIDRLTQCFSERNGYIKELEMDRLKKYEGESEKEALLEILEFRNRYIEKIESKNHDLEMIIVNTHSL